MAFAFQILLTFLTSKPYYMKRLLLPFFVCLPFFGFCQAVDTAVITRQVDSLIQTSRSLTNQQQYGEAMQINDVAEQMAFEKLGIEHAAHGKCLFNHGYIFNSQGKLEDAERYYLDAKTIQENALGVDPLDLAATLNNLGLIYRRQEQFEAAEPLYLKVKEIREEVFTKVHKDYAAIANNLGALYTYMFRFREAEKNLLEAKGLWEYELKMDSVQYANVLDNLADVYIKTERYEEAEPLYLKAKDIREKVLGEFHPDYAGLLNDLANLYSDVARYEEAERYYLQAMEIQIVSLGKESFDYAQSLNNLAILYKDLGRYEEGERCLLEAKEIWEKTAGTGSKGYGDCLDNTASLYYKLGLFDAAEPVYKEALAIRKKAHPGSVEYSVSLNNLAVLYMAKEDYAVAEPLSKEVKSIFENIGGRENTDHAWSLNNLAILYDKMGRYADADTLLLSAKRIREEILGNAHPDYANTLEDLAILYQKMNNPEAALKLHLEAKTIFEKTLGKAHPRYEECIRNLAVLYQKQGKLELAGPLLLEANDLQRGLLLKSTRYLSERELAANAITFATGLDGLYSFGRQNPAINAKLLSILFDNTIFHKGFLLTASNQVKHLAMRDTASCMRYELLTSYHRRLATEYAKPIEEREGVATLEQKANELEKELVRTVAGFGEAIRQVNWKEVQSKLQPGEAVVEFVHYHYRNPETTDSVFYSALVLQPGDATPRFVHLCEEKSLDSLFGAGTSRRSDYVADLYNYHERGATPLGKPTKSLYDLLWQPLEAALKSVKTVYFSPSGLMHRLNLGAIPIDGENTLADTINLVQLGSTRQLVVPNAVNIVNQEALLVGAVQYELDSAAIAERKISAEMLASRGQEDRKLNIDPVPVQRGSAWTFLNWTNKEVSSIQSIAKAAGMAPDTRTGNAATEEAFKQIGRGKPSPRSIHLATHGYFFPDPTPQPPKGGVGPGSPLGAGGEPVFKISAQPMIRSGLILAGGNYSWLTGRPLLPDMEDGILTAYEISQMDLSHTELAALSACETGLGDIKGNEGVYGLQRAFKIAGVKYIVMSLWEVPDEQTKKLMTLFYSKWLEDKMAIPDAFRAAQKEMREIGFSPYQWAGFVLVE